jgi:hypothetical protein
VPLVGGLSLNCRWWHFRLHHYAPTAFDRLAMYNGGQASMAHDHPAAWLKVTAVRVGGARCSHGLAEAGENSATNHARSLGCDVFCTVRMRHPHASIFTLDSTAVASSASARTRYLGLGRSYCACSNGRSPACLLNPIYSRPNTSSLGTQTP